MKISAHQGAVLYFWNEQLAPKFPHWHIVLATDTRSTDGCYVSICTSKTAPLHKKIELGYIKPETVVFIPRGAYSEFTAEETAINCHDTKALTGEALARMKQSSAKYRLRQCKNFPSDYLRKIIDGVLLSVETDNAIRASLLCVKEEEVSSAMFARFGMKLKDFLPEMYKVEADKNTYVPKSGIKIVVTPK